MKQKADEIKSRLDDVVLQAEAAGGDIRVEITGNRKIRSIFIAPALQHGDKEELEEQLVVAMNRAIEKASGLNDEEMKKAASGLIPGL